MATVSAKSATFNASTQKYKVVLENATLVRWDRDTTQLIIELDKNTVSIDSLPPKPNSPILPQFNNRISSPRYPIKKPTIIIKSPFPTSQSTPNTPQFNQHSSNRSNTSNHRYHTVSNHPQIKETQK